MTNRLNPFEFLEAINLSKDTILDYYIEDFNYSRFIQSKRNILLVGERGSGKSMMLLYNSLAVQTLKASRNNQGLDYETVGVYIPCNTPITHKSEYSLMGDLQAIAISEHHLVLSIVYHIAATLAQISNVMEDADEASIRSRLEYVFDSKLPELPFFEAIMSFVDRENVKTQQMVNSAENKSFSYDDTFTFSSLASPILNSIRKIPKLKDTHLLLLVDDAHDLNKHQVRLLNSWIAYRDHSLFSFKVAVADILKSSLKTDSGGTILEGHDYTRIDMAQAFHNDSSNYGKQAIRLVSKRLEQFDMDCDPTAFFPSSKKNQADLEKAEKIVKAEAIEKYGDDSKKVSDYIYKYKRATYFRSRSPNANRPEYSGFDTLVFLSTGVTRNLLIPMYWMFDRVYSNSTSGSSAIKEIPPSVQTEIILERSRYLWDFVRDELDQTVANCSSKEALMCFQLLDQLAVHFRERLLESRSEPRANSFTVSGSTQELMDGLEPLFRILRAAQILYIRTGPAKAKGRREKYYIPNRMLWPDRGLDPHGQHARVSLPAAELWMAASENKPINYKKKESNLQPDLFDE